MNSVPQTLGLGFWDKAQYRLLRKFWPGSTVSVDGCYSGESKLRIQLGPEAVAALQSAECVIDFGCGEGAEAVQLARLGCKRVIGVDIQEPYLERARQRAVEEGVASQCQFMSSAPDASCDAIVSLDAFEHFDNPGAILQIMYRLLRPGGRVFIAFGPTWLHPLGGHIFSVFPWAHLVFSERALCAWRSHIRTDGARSFRECTGGLNQITIEGFEKVVSSTDFQLERLEPVPIRKLKPIHSRWTREWTSSIVRATLRKPGAA